MNSHETHGSEQPLPRHGNGKRWILLRVLCLFFSSIVSIAVILKAIDLFR